MRYHVRTLGSSRSTCIRRKANKSHGPGGLNVREEAARLVPVWETDNNQPPDDLKAHSSTKPRPVARLVGRRSSNLHRFEPGFTATTSAGRLGSNHQTPPSRQRGLSAATVRPPPPSPPQTHHALYESGVSEANRASGGVSEPGGEVAEQRLLLARHLRRLQHVQQRQRALAMHLRQAGVTSADMFNTVWLHRYTDRLMHGRIQEREGGRGGTGLWPSKTSKTGAKSTHLLVHVDCI